MEEPSRHIPGVTFDANAKLTEDMQKRVERMYDMARTRDIVKKLRDRLFHMNNMG